MTSDSIPPTLIAASEPDDASRASILQGSGGPGRAIRAARERARLSVEELAAQTKLARGTLEALERDDFESLNEPVYVRGYYRKCAKVLALDEADLIAGYEKLAVPKAPQVPTKLLFGGSPAIGRPRARRRGGAGRLVSILMIAVAIGGAAWFVMNDPGLLASLRGTASGAPTPAVTEPRPAAIPSTPAHLLPEAGSIPAPPAAEPAASASVPRDSAVAPTGNASDPGAGAPAAPAAATSMTSTPSAVSAPTPGPTPGPTSAPTSAPASPSAPGAASVTPNRPATIPAPASSTGADSASTAASGSLKLTFKSTSWIRVEDADGRVLLSGVVQAGDRQQLHGRTPYNLFVGNAPGVVVEYDGKTIDTAPYVKSNSTARLTVP